ncbi:MAG: dihydrofolate reductase [Oscillospiraceae bacterium]|nr:dihydrofolate reductase [Oscillospiraceae bacterium]
MEAIVAVSENWGIGKDGELLFHIRDDLRRFRALTEGRTVLMGRKTLESLPGGRGLPNRRNIVVSRRAGWTAENAEVFSDLQAAADAAGDDAVVIGGGSIYRALLPLCRRVRATKVFAAPPADTFFPNLDEDPAWHAVWQSEVMEENGVSFQYVDYERI